jgi:hypothetical protein
MSRDVSGCPLEEEGTIGIQQAEAGVALQYHVV